MARSGQLWHASRVWRTRTRQYFANPGERRLTLGSGVLERLTLEIGMADLEGVALIQKSEGPLCFDVTARLHGECGLTVQHCTLQELYRVLVTMTTGMLK
jgi:hypothetical protein